MVRSFLQTVDFTNLAMQRLQSACDALSQAAQKGTIARAWDICPGMVAFILVCVVLALALAALLVAVAWQDRRLAALHNAYQATEQDTIREIATVNLRNR